MSVSARCSVCLSFFFSLLLFLFSAFFVVACVFLFLGSFFFSLELVKFDVWLIYRNSYVPLIFFFFLDVSRILFFFFVIVVVVAVIIINSFLSPSLTSCLCYSVIKEKGLARPGCWQKRMCVWIKLSHAQMKKKSKIWSLFLFSSRQLLQQRMKIQRRKKSARTDKKAHRIWKKRLPQRPVASWKLTLRLFAWDKINYDALLFLFFFFIPRPSTQESSSLFPRLCACLTFRQSTNKKKGEKSNGLKSYLQKKLFPEQSRVDDRLRVTTKPKCAMSRQETAHLKEKKKRTSPPRHFSTTLASVPLFFFWRGWGWPVSHSLLKS